MAIYRHSTCERRLVIELKGDVLNSEIIDLQAENLKQSYDELSKHKFATDLLLGLSAQPKHIPSKYFYDDAGSRLFQQIMNLPEYYLTNCEMQVLETHAADIVSKLGSGPVNIVELGAGDGSKTKVILKSFFEKNIPITYYPLDISNDALKQLISAFGKEFEQLKIQGIQSDYEEGVRWISKHNSQKNLILFLGSNIGNMLLKDAKTFLRKLWKSLNHEDEVLIGFDLKKDISLLLPAYNDSQGITRDFNLNLLTHVNDRLGANFNTDNFRHYGTYDAERGAMVSYLISLKSQDVHIANLNKTFSFLPFEPIQVEFSYKFLIEEIEEISQQTGFRIEAEWYDEKGWYVDVLLSVQKNKK